MDSLDFLQGASTFAKTLGLVACVLFEYVYTKLAFDLDVIQDN